MHINWGDVVAVYAAVVATGALGWQVYQSWLQRASRLEVAHVYGWLNRDASVCVEGTIYNANDYPVKIRLLDVETWTRDEASRRAGQGGRMLTPEEAGLPDEIAARDSVDFRVERLRTWQEFGAGGYVQVAVVTSLHRWFAGPRVPIQGSASAVRWSPDIDRSAKSPAERDEPDSTT